ncbi:hypothetical protein ALP99_200308 [Pseudomonas syringae pv. tomato]|nr:hypothetical protein ALP99_200308 [Pseudomonas syringae pv. tomato]
MRGLSGIAFSLAISRTAERGTCSYIMGWHRHGQRQQRWVMSAMMNLIIRSV